MTEVTTISISSEDRYFLKEKGFSASRVLRKAILDLREGKDTEELKTKLKKWVELYHKSISFIEISGLRKQWENYNERNN